MPHNKKAARRTTCRNLHKQINSNRPLFQSFRREIANLHENTIFLRDRIDNIIIQNTYLKSLHEIALAFLNHLDTHDILESIIHHATKLIKTPHAFLCLVIPPEDILELKKGLGLYDALVGLQIHAGEGLAGTILQTGQPMLVRDYHGWHGSMPDLKQTPIKSAMAVPLISSRKIFGVVGLSTTTDRPDFGENELMLLSRFAELASLAFNTARVHTTARQELLHRKQAEEQLHYIDSHDPLTGLYNRAYFEDTIHALTDANYTTPGLIIYDIDGLKIINDTMGHHAGDQLLVCAANIIKTSAPDNAVIARIGGDEFITLLLTADVSFLEHINKKTRQAVARYNADNPQLSLSLSVGYALKVAKDSTIADLFKEADDNMYREKLHHSQSVRSTIVQGLLKALEARDFITEGHGERLEKLVVALASCLGLSERQIADLRLLAKFHDIGKVGIPDSILFKTSTLTWEEREEMKRHCEIGQRIALAAIDLAPIAEHILHHHEWWNGNGYPMALKGNSIPLNCRILAIVDAYDAMTNDRPYRKALSHKYALAELRKYAGIQFDPKLVASFIKIINAHPDIPCTPHRLTPPPSGSPQPPKG